MNYQELVSETGFLTPKGKELANQKVFQGAKELLDMMETEIELRIMAGTLSKHIGDLVANKLAEQNQKRSELDAMSDQEFEASMKAKYGENWMLKSITPEELRRCPVISKEKLQAAFQEGLEARKSVMMAQGVHGIHDLKFK